MVNSRWGMALGFIVANLAVVAVAAAVLLNRPLDPPIIQGVLLPEGRSLAPFTLIDHHGDAFSNDDLIGNWHLVSYGFTACPDICPTTLHTLGNMVGELREAGAANDLSVLFYTVDHRRDDSARLAQYVPYFDPDFIGLTHADDPANPHLPFERSLGISATLAPYPDSAPDSTDYQVSHGVSLLLVNPAGELQAIFKPDNPAPGTHSFNETTLRKDYLAVREYIAAITSD